MTVMKYSNFTKLVFILVNVLLLCLTSAISSDQQPVADARVIFHVAWYDVGKTALEGLNGIKKVEKGIQRNKLWFKEINTVVYDPQLVTIEEMKGALQEAGTYKGILKPEEPKE